MASPKELPRDSELLKTMRRRFSLADTSESKQCERERDDISFEDGNQWPPDSEQARGGMAAGAISDNSPEIPQRPTIVIDMVKEPVRQILNQERQADIGIQLTPADDFGDLGIVPDDTEVELREGLIRKIQRESHAADARSWAFKRAVIAGRGYYIVRNRFLPGKTWDQEIYVDKIFEQAGVKLDPSHTSSVGADADWEFMGTWMPWDRFNAEYEMDADGRPNPFIEWSDGEYMGMSESYPDWYRKVDGPDSERAVRIVDYWYTERTTRTVGATSDGRTFWVGDPPEDASPEEAAMYAPKDTQFVDTRSVTEKQIKFCKVAGGCMELERTDEIGPFMPIVKMVGDEVLPYDEQRRYNGVVRAARGPQIGVNYLGSKMIEQIGQTPIPSLQVDPEAIDGYESWYALMNTRALPYAPYRSYDDQGRPLNPPTRFNADPNIGPVAAAFNMFVEMVQTTTAVPDPTMGHVDPSLKSGKAIQAVVANAAMSTSNFMDNFKRSMTYEAELINGKMYGTYGNRPGRLVRTLTGEGEEKTMGIGDPQDAQLQQTLQQKAAKVGKLTKDAHFNVIAKMAKSSENRRQQFVEMFAQIIGADPTQMGVAGDLFYKNMDIPDARQLAERQKTVLLPPVQAMLAAEKAGTQPPDPQMEQAQQMIQQLQQALAEAQSGTQETQMKVQSDQQIADKKAQLEFALAKLDADTKMQIADKENQRDIQLAIIKRETDLQIAGADINQKREEVAIDAQVRQADALLRDQGNVRDTLAGLQDSHEGRQHEAEQSDKAAAMQQQENQV